MSGSGDSWSLEDHSGVLAITRVDHGSEAVVVLKGELDLNCSVPVTGCVSEVLDIDGIGRIVFDLSNLDFIDSSGLQLLIDTQTRALAAGVEFRLRAPSRPVVRVLDICRLENFFPIDGPAGR